MQGGINPDMPPFKYRDLLDAMKRAFPEIHIHAFSPMEIMYGAKRVRMDYPEIHHDAQGTRASARFRGRPRKSLTMACAKS